MRDLRLIGVHEDGQHLLLSDSEGERFRVLLDEPLRAAARRDRPRLGQLQIEIDGGMRPREVQALIRAGYSAEEVADRAGWSVEKVQRYEGPILAEREHVAGLARQVRLRGRSGAGASAPSLASRVSQRLSGRGVDPAHAAWDSARNDEGEWTVIVSFPAGGRERLARWAFDVQSRTVTAADDEARWLSEDDATGAASPLPAPHLVSSPVRVSTVYDVEAEGGVQGNPRRATSTPAEQPLDLMTAMRERASHRGRPRRRKPAATQTPVDAAPRADALPLEDIGYDPESMPAPPAARGAHALDETSAEHDNAGEDVLPAAPVESPAAPAADSPVAESPVAESPAAEDDSALPVAAPAPPESSRPGSSRPESSRPKPSKKAGRPSVPSWDDVMFGAKPRD